jgi:ectoine hydroxylase-related dioxygenase (phytanoyl-CoA dioxygenase family)
MEAEALLATEAGRICDEIRYRGFAVLEGVLTLDQIGHLNAQLDRVYALQCAEVGGERVLASINDADIVRCPLAYDDCFLALACDESIRAVASQLLGEHVLLLQNGVINRPGQSGQNQHTWHRDLNYQYWTSSRPLAVSALVCLEDFNPTTGGTVLLPSSHKIERLPSETVIAECALPVMALAGSIIFFDAMVFHRAGINTSGRIRRAVNHVVGVPILCQQLSIPAVLGRHAPGDPDLAAYLGHRWSAATSVAAWRLARIARQAVSHQAASQTEGN